MPRPAGSGKPKGYKAPNTLAKEAARDLVFTRVRKELSVMLDSQIANAKGLSYLVKRDRRTGKFIARVDAAEAAKLSDADSEGSEFIITEVWEKDPSVQAFSDLLNRALGKPIEEVQLQVSGEVSVIQSRLNAARARFAATRKPGQAPSA